MAMLVALLKSLVWILNADLLAPLSYFVLLE